MKIIAVLLLIVVAGCRTVAPVAPLPLPAKSVPEPRPIAAMSAPAAAIPPPTSAQDLKLRQQMQLIEALISQNDALTLKLATQPPTMETPMASPPLPAPAPIAFAPPPPVLPAPPPPLPPPPPTPLNPVSESLLSPNADGIIDLTAVSIAAASDEPVNPFAVRMISPESSREIALQVGGIVAGKIPCAIINERLVQPGDTIESFALERIESDAVVLSRGEHRLRLPIAQKPARVRLAL